LALRKEPGSHSSPPRTRLAEDKKQTPKVPPAIRKSKVRGTSLQSLIFSISGLMRTSSETIVHYTLLSLAGTLGRWAFSVQSVQQPGTLLGIYSINGQDGEAARFFLEALALRQRTE
jgi:hypothetical protein